jgi:polyisoprenoid-binding protein YceI
MRKLLFLLLWLPIYGQGQDQLVESEVTFKVGNMLVNTVRGAFAPAEGTVFFDPSNLEESSFDVYIRAETIDTGNAKRDKELRGEEFFDVENTPEIRIESSEISQKNEGVFQLKGSLTMRGIERPFEADFQLTENGQQMELRSEFTVNREEFNLGTDYGGFMIDEEIEVTVVLVVD